MGLRSHDFAPVDSFEDLRARLVGTVAPPTTALAGFVGKSLTDVGWVFEYHGDDPRVAVRFGPMRADQARTTLFRDKDESHFPPEFLILDVDRVLEKSLTDGPSAIERWADSVEKNRALVARLAEWFTETIK